MSKGFKKIEVHIVLAIFLICKAEMPVQAMVVTSRQLSKPNTESQQQIQNKETPLSSSQNIIFNPPAPIPQTEGESLHVHQGGRPLAMGLPSTFVPLPETVYAYLGSQVPYQPNGQLEPGLTSMGDGSPLLRDNVPKTLDGIQISQTEPETTVLQGSEIQGTEATIPSENVTGQSVDTSRNRQNTSFDPSQGEEKISSFQEPPIAHPELPEILTTPLPLVDETGLSEPSTSNNVISGISTTSTAPENVATLSGGQIPLTNKTIAETIAMDNNPAPTYGTGSIMLDSIPLNGSVQVNVTKDITPWSQNGKNEHNPQIRNHIKAIDNLVDIINNTVAQNTFSDGLGSSNEGSTSLQRTLSEMSKIRKLISLINDVKSTKNLTLTRNNSPDRNLSNIIERLVNAGLQLSSLSAGKDSDLAIINRIFSVGTTPFPVMIPQNVSRLSDENQTNIPTTLHMSSESNTIPQEGLPDNLSTLIVKQPVNPSTKESGKSIPENLRGQQINQKNQSNSDMIDIVPANKINQPSDLSYITSDPAVAESTVPRPTTTEWSFDPVDATTVVNPPTSSKSNDSSIMDINTLLNSISLLELANRTDGISLNISNMENMSREEMTQNLLKQVRSLQNISKVQELVIANHTLPDNILQTLQSIANDGQGNYITSGNLENFHEITVPTTTVSYTESNTNNEQNIDYNSLLNSISLLDLQQLVNQTEGMAFNFESIGNLSRKEILEKLLEQVRILQETSGNLVSSSNQTQLSNTFTNNTFRGNNDNNTNNDVHNLSPKIANIVGSPAYDTNVKIPNIRDPSIGKEDVINTVTTTAGVEYPNDIISSLQNIGNSDINTNSQNYTDQLETTTVAIPSTSIQMNPHLGNTVDPSQASELHGVLNAISLEDLQRLVNQTRGIDFDLASLGNLSRKQIIEKLLDQIQNLQNGNSQAGASNSSTTSNFATESVQSTLTPKTEVNNISSSMAELRHNQQTDMDSLIQSPSTISPIIFTNGQSSGRNEINDLLNSISLQDLQYLIDQTQGINLNVSEMRNQSREQLLKNLLKTVQDLQNFSTQAVPNTLNSEINTNIPAATYSNNNAATVNNANSIGVPASTTSVFGSSSFNPHVIGSSTQSLENQNPTHTSFQSFQNSNPKFTDNQYHIDSLTNNQNPNVIGTSNLHMYNPRPIIGSSGNEQTNNSTALYPDLPVVKQSDINNILNSVSIQDLQGLVDQTEGISVDLAGLGTLDRNQVLQTLLAKVQAIKKQRTNMSKPNEIFPKAVEELQPNQQGSQPTQNPNLSASLTHNIAKVDHGSIKQNNQFHAITIPKQPETKLTENQQHFNIGTAHQPSHNNEPETNAGNVQEELGKPQEYNLKSANEEITRGHLENYPWLTRMPDSVNTGDGPAMQMDAEVPEEPEPSPSQKIYYWDQFTKTYRLIHPRFLSSLSSNNEQNENVEVEAPVLEDGGDDSSSSSDSDER